MTEALTTLPEILNSIQLNLKAPKDQKNSFGNYKYRKAEDILEALKEELKKDSYSKNCSVRTPIRIEVIGGRVFVVCDAVLMVGKDCIEASGFAELDTTKKGMDQAQLTGAATSYAKKYALGNLFAIDDSKDDPDLKEEVKTNHKQLANIADDLKNEMGGLVKENKLDKANEFLKKIKIELKAASSVEKVNEICERNKKLLGSLEENYKDLFEVFKDCKKGMIEILSGRLSVYGWNPEQDSTDIDD